jgi:type I restriction enzyme M protein
VFAPYTGIKTNLLFFTKGEPTKDVWFYEHSYAAGAKSYSKTKPIWIEEFDIEKEWWKKRKENSQAWKVSIEQLQANGYNLDVKNPHHAGGDAADADVLLADYQQLLSELQGTWDRLKDELMKALQQ